MAKRINRAIELLAADQALYYDGPHTGHVLTYEQGHKDANRREDGRQYRAHDAGCQRELRNRAALVLHDDTADIALTDQALDFVDDVLGLAALASKITLNLALAIHDIFRQVLGSERKRRSGS